MNVVVGRSRGFCRTIEEEVFCSVSQTVIIIEQASIFYTFADHSESFQSEFILCFVVNWDWMRERVACCFIFSSGGMMM